MTDICIEFANLMHSTDSRAFPNISYNSFKTTRESPFLSFVDYYLFFLQIDNPKYRCGVFGFLFNMIRSEYSAFVALMH